MSSPATVALPSRGLRTTAPRTTLRAIAAPTLIATVLAIVYLIWEPPSADLAAQEFRTWLFQQHGFTPWDGQWFGGHHTPGYSLLFPPLAAVLGPRLVGALATVAAAAAFAAIADGVWGERSRVGALWFGAAVAASLFNGRMTFALGVAVALAAVLAFQRGRPVLACALAALTGVTSPIAALFLTLVAVAYTIGTRRSLGLVFAACAFVPTAALAWAFPEGGAEPFVLSAFAGVFVVVVIALLALPSDERVLRAAAALYGLAAIAAFLLDTPMGGNASRLETLFAGPLLACALWGRRTALLAAIAPLLLFLQLGPPVRDVARAEADPAVAKAFYAPLFGFLRHDAATGRPPVRIEVLPTEDHWEARWVAPHYPIARGWVRQLDRLHGELFYRSQLNPVAYRHWVEDLGVGLIAVPHAPLDYAAVPEARLIRRGLPWLTPVFRSAGWTVYRVRDAVPLVSPPARVTALTPAGVSLTTPRPASVVVRVRWSPYWALVEGTGCVQRGPAGMTRVRLRDAGRARIAIRFSPVRAFSRGPRCTSGI